MTHPSIVWPFHAPTTPWVRFFIKLVSYQFRVSHLKGCPIHNITLWQHTELLRTGITTALCHPITRLLIVQIGKVLAIRNFVADMSAFLRTRANGSRHHPDIA